MTESKDDKFRYYFSDLQSKYRDLPPSAKSIEPFDSVIYRWSLDISQHLKSNENEDDETAELLASLWHVVYSWYFERNSLSVSAEQELVRLQGDPVANELNRIKNILLSKTNEKEKIWNHLIELKKKFDKVMDITNASYTKELYENKFLSLIAEYNVLKEPSQVMSDAKPEPKPNKEKEIEKLNWQGTTSQLVYLFEQLYEKGLLSRISNRDEYALIANHFTVRGNALNNKSLEQTRRNYGGNKNADGKPRGSEEIDKIVSEVKEFREPKRETK